MLRSLALLLFAAAALCPGAVAEEGASLEYEVKAACVFNFAKFVEWPAAKFPKADTPIVIGILGDDPFGGNMERVVAGETINGRGIEIKRLGRTDDMGACTILFVSDSARKFLPELEDALKKNHVLVVGESGDFLDIGGMIRFVLEDRKVRFEIDLDQAEAVGLKISSKLLKLARRVKTARK